MRLKGCYPIPSWFSFVAILSHVTIQGCQISELGVRRQKWPVVYAESPSP